MKLQKYQKCSKVTRGLRKAEFVLKNARIVNVFTREILEGDIAIQDGMIVGIGNYQGEEETDLGGRYVCPGFIDSHLHLESTLVTPAELVTVASRHGTTTFIVDPHESANVSGLKGIDYILNPDKTEERYIGGNAGSTTQEVYNRMMATKQEFRKLDGRQCYHFIISFAPGETDAITCFNIAQDFCEKYLAGKYEYVFSVHTDHAHMHAHIVFNSVSLVDGVKYHYSDGQWKSNIQPITDQLCEKYGLKKLTYVPGKRKGVDYGTWREKKDPSGSQRLREAIDMAIAQSDSYDDFLSIMRKSYQVKIGFSQKWNSEYLSFKDFKTPAGRYRRNYVLGKSYTVASIQKRISLNKMEIPESLKRLPPHIRGFESSIGSGFRSANGLYLTQHQKRYMIPYWRLKNSERTVTSGTGNIREYSKEADRNLRDRLRMM